MTIVPQSRKAVDPELAEVLRALGAAAEAMEWRVGPHPEAQGPESAAALFFTWGDEGKWVPGREMVEVAGAGVELFGGEVAARVAGDVRDALVLRPRRHAGWEVEAHDAALVGKLQSAFPNVVRLGGGKWQIPPGNRSAPAPR